MNMITLDDICDIIAVGTIMRIITGQYQNNDKGMSITMINIAYDMIMRGEY